jgi:ABC-type transport system involved in cytochrome bd biosynthesis fused ATPase/permease subunit
MVWFPAALAASAVAWTYLETAASHMRRLQPREGVSIAATRRAESRGSFEPNGLELASPLLDRRPSRGTSMNGTNGTPFYRSPSKNGSAPAAVAIRDLTVRGNLERCILDNVKVEFAEGRKVAIVGSSGEGKTALLHVLQGRLIPTMGSVKIHDKEVCTLRHGQKGKMYAPNHPFFSPTPRAQLALDAKKRVNEEDWVELLASLGTDVRTWRLGLDTPTLELPGGDWEALSLARTILEPSDPPLYLLDMPPRNCLKKVLQLEGTVVCVLPTKDVHETASGFDEVVVMNQGRIARHGSPEQLQADLRALHYGLWEGLVKAEPLAKHRASIGTAPMRIDT